ncbi:MAG: TATA-box-binding protein [Nanoarchaeota archaeon]|nr:TATA-box-binding protein [Nanoarchaeota archaeon]
MAKTAKLEVVNMVVTTDLKHKLNLETIASKLSNTEYNPEQFPGLVIRIKDPKTSALLFSSGKVVCTGARSIVYAEKSVQKIINFLKKIDIEITVKPKLKVQNFVGSGELNFNLNLNVLAIKLRNSDYEPEQFPGLVYKIKTPFYASFLLFSNGKIVCTGTKNEEEMDKCLEQLVKNLKKIDGGLKRKRKKR